MSQMESVPHHSYADATRQMLEKWSTEKDYIECLFLALDPQGKLNCMEMLPEFLELFEYWSKWITGVKPLMQEETPSTASRYLIGKILNSFSKNMRAEVIGRLDYSCHKWSEWSLKMLYDALVEMLPSPLLAHVKGSPIVRPRRKKESWAEYKSYIRITLKWVFRVDITSTSPPDLVVAAQLVEEGHSQHYWKRWDQCLQPMRNYVDEITREGSAPPSVKDYLELFGRIDCIARPLKKR